MGSFPSHETMGPQDAGKTLAQPKDTLLSPLVIPVDIACAEVNWDTKGSTCTDAFVEVEPIL